MSQLALDVLPVGRPSPPLPSYPDAGADAGQDSFGDCLCRAHEPAAPPTAEGASARDESTGAAGEQVEVNGSRQPAESVDYPRDDASNGPHTPGPAPAETPEESPSEDQAAGEAEETAVAETTTAAARSLAPEALVAIATNATPDDSANGDAVGTTHAASAASGELHPATPRPAKGPAARATPAAPPTPHTDESADSPTTTDGLATRVRLAPEENAPSAPAPAGNADASPHPHNLRVADGSKGKAAPKSAGRPAETSESKAGGERRPADSDAPGLVPLAGATGMDTAEQPAAEQPVELDRFRGTADAPKSDGGAPVDPIGDRPSASTLAEGRHGALESPATSSRSVASPPLGPAVIPGERTLTEVEHARFVQRVARAFHTVGEAGGTVRLRLSPPELGSLRLEVALRDGVMHARLETETTGTRTLLLDSLPALRERLAQQDIRLERFDVDVMGQSPGGLPRQPGDERGGDERAGGGGPSPRVVVRGAAHEIPPRGDLPTDGRLNVVI